MMKEVECVQLVQKLCIRGIVKSVREKSEEFNGLFDVPKSGSEIID